MTSTQPNRSEAELLRLSAEDHKIEMIIGRLLQTCVILTIVIVLVGVAYFLPGAASVVPQYHTFRGEPAELRSVWGIIRAAGSGNGRGIIQAGLLLLILTPILRVIFSVFAFLYERDYLYVGLTIVVLALLLFSLSGG